MMRFLISARTWRVIFWTCLIAVLVLSLLPDSGNTPTTGWDKLNHFLAFAALAIIGMQTYPKLTTALLSGLFLFGGLIEVLQSFTPNRFAELGDLTADGVGLLAGWILMALFLKFRRTWSSN